MGTKNGRSHLTERDCCLNSVPIAFSCQMIPDQKLTTTMYTHNTGTSPRNRINMLRATPPIVNAQIYPIGRLGNSLVIVYPMNVANENSINGNPIFNPDISTSAGVASCRKSSRHDPKIYDCTSADSKKPAAVISDANCAAVLKENDVGGGRSGGTGKAIGSRLIKRQKRWVIFIVVPRVDSRMIASRLPECKYAFAIRFPVMNTDDLFLS